MKWIKASERLPDSSDFWLAKSETQEGKVVLCKVNDIIGHGFFWRRDGRMCFSYSFERKEGGFWHTDDSAFVPYEEFDKIEWLDETPDQTEPLPESSDSSAEDKRILNEAKISALVIDWFASWCKKTKRSGGVLITTSIKEVLCDFYNDNITAASTVSEPLGEDAIEVWEQFINDWDKYAKHEHSLGNNASIGEFYTDNKTKYQLYRKQSKQ